MRSNIPWALFLVAVFCSVVVATGCARRGGMTSNEIQIDVAVEPQPLTSGPATVIVTLKDATGQPVKDAEVEVEGNMSHAGMTPVIVTAVEGEDGRYETRDFEFTMAGDWFFVVRATLPDGSEIKEIIELEEPVRASYRAAQAQMQARDAWVRPAAAGYNSAVYMRLVNETATGDRVVAAHSNVAARVEMHETKAEGDVMRMAPVEAVDLEPHGEVVFQPGGLHVMLVDLKHDLQPGDRFELMLELASGGRIPVQVDVRQR